MLLLHVLCLCAYEWLLAQAQVAAPIRQALAVSNATAAGTLPWTGIVVVGHTGYQGQIYLPDCVALIKSDDFGFNSGLIYPAACTCSCKVYTSGGFGNDGGYSTALLQYDPSTDTTVTLAHMAEARVAHSLTCFDSQNVVACGGWHETQGLSSCEMCHLSEGTCTSLASMPRALYYHAAAVHASVLYVVGGTTNNEQPSDALFQYSYVLDEWTQLASMGVQRYWFPGAISVGGSLLVCGGTNGTYSNTCQLYDALNNVWSTGPTMHTPRSDFGLVSYEGVVYAVGGSDGYALQSVEYLNVANNSWLSDSQPLAQANGATYAMGAIDSSCKQ